MNKKAKVSIITITYNAEKYVERTIKSVLSQDYPNIEYLIIDGLSTDGTLDIVKKYKGGITRCVSEPDKGIYDAMNKGLDEATGDYVVFMNAGDVIADDKALSNLMSGSNGADFIYGRMIFIDEAGNTRPFRKKTPAADKINAKSFINGMVVCHQCMIVKRSIAPYYQLKPWRIANDLEWTIRMMKKVKTSHFYDGVFCLFLEGGASDGQRYDAVYDRFRISKLHFGLIPTILQQFKIVFQSIRRGRIS